MEPESGPGSDTSADSEATTEAAKASLLAPGFVFAAAELSPGLLGCTTELAMNFFPTALTPATAWHIAGQVHASPFFALTGHAIRDVRATLTFARHAAWDMRAA